jgi:hypothetical protein
VLGGGDVPGRDVCASVAHSFVDRLHQLPSPERLYQASSKSRCSLRVSYTAAADAGPAGVAAAGGSAYFWQRPWNVDGPR